jgi:hypothetical protein
MTWQEAPSILELLSKETYDALARRRLSPANTAGVSPLSQSMSVPADEVARHIQAFVSDFRWPTEAQDGLLFECTARIYQAQMLVKFVLSESKQIPMNHVVNRDDLPDRFLLLWLLTDYWNYAGCWRQIFRCSTPNKPAA